MVLSIASSAFSSWGFGSWPMLDTAVVAKKVAIPLMDVEDTSLRRFKHMDKVIHMGSSGLHFPLAGPCHVSQDLGLKLKRISKY